MKILFGLLSLSSLIYAVNEEIDTLALTQNQIPSEEVVALDLSLIQQPISSTELQPPAPVFKPSGKSPTIAASLSSLLPGLGHVYLADPKTASGIFGTSCLGIGAAGFRNADMSVRSSAFITGQSAWSYGIYAAYRDARMANGQAGYKYKMPTDSLSDLTFAPLKWSVLKKPEVWGGFLGAFALAATTAYFAFPEEAHVGDFALSKYGRLSPFVALPVGVGEESLFRGYLLSQLSESLSPWGGIAVSSLLFGAAHIPNGLLLEGQARTNYFAFSLPLITAFGAYFGWMTHKNHSLQESVALHTWYDFTLFALGSFATKAAIGEPSFAIALPF